MLSDFIFRHARLYFPYLKHANPKQFQEFLNLFDRLAVRQPDNLSDHRHVAVFLHKNANTEEFANRVIELINTEVLVEKKSQNIKGFKINQFFSEFIVRHIEKFVPQLERLLVRSESNVEVWEEFVTIVRNWKGIDQHALALIRKIKNLYMVHPEPCIKIIVTLTSQLTDEKVIRELISYLSALFGGEHTSKKKILYVRMLQGVVASLKDHADHNLRNLLYQEIIVMLANGLIKFTDEEEFNVLVEFIDSIVEHIA